MSVRDALDVLGGQVCFLPADEREALRGRIQAQDWPEWRFAMSEFEALQVCVWDALQRRLRFAEAQELQAPHVIPTDVRMLAVNVLLEKIMREAGRPDYFTTPRPSGSDAMAKFEQGMAELGEKVAEDNLRKMVAKGGAA